jgi:hypothetical protein
MILPSRSFGVVAASRKKIVVASGGTDVIPNSINWGDYSFGQGPGSYSIISRQITGIDTSITLKVNYTQIGYTVYYYVSSSPPPFITFTTSGANDVSTSPSVNMTPILDGETFSVTNNQYIAFGAVFTNVASDLVYIRNASDGDTLLGTPITAYYDP